MLSSTLSRLDTGALHGLERTGRGDAWSLRLRAGLCAVAIQKACSSRWLRRTAGYSRFSMSLSSLSRRDQRTDETEEQRLSSGVPGLSQAHGGQGRALMSTCELAAPLSSAASAGASRERRGGDGVGAPVRASCCEGSREVERRWLATVFSPVRAQGSTLEQERPRIARERRLRWLPAAAHQLRKLASDSGVRSQSRS